MRRISPVLLTVAALLALSFSWQEPASAQMPKMEAPAEQLDPSWGSAQASRDGLGKKIAGTYLAQFEFPVTEPPAPMIVTIDAGGTMVSTSSAALGRGAPELFLLRQNIHTTWKKTGRRELTTRHLLFLHNPDGSLLWIVRTIGVWRFDEDLDSFNGEFTAEIFLPEQLAGPELRGPMTPNTTEPPAIGVFPGGTFQGKRLEVPDDD